MSVLDLVAENVMPCANPKLTKAYKISPQAMRLIKNRKFQIELCSAISKSAPIDVTVWKNYVEFEYKPKSYFDKKSFRYYRVGNRGTMINLGCAKRYWDSLQRHVTRKGRIVQGSCDRSMEVHHVLVPIDRVEQLAAAWGVSMRKRKRTVAANPLLLSISPNGMNDFLELPASNPDKKIKWAVHISSKSPYMVEAPRAVFFASKAQAEIEARGYRRAGYNAKVRKLTMVEERAMATRGLVGNNPFVTFDDVGNNPYVTFDDVGNNPCITGRSKRRTKNKRIARNPSHQSPFPQGRQIPIEQFEEWLYASGDSQLIKRYEHQKQKFMEAHEGAMPRSITRDVLNVGVENAVTDRDVIISMGKAPADLYSVPEWSGKAKKSRNWQHDWKTPPDVGITADGKARISLLKGTARVSRGWMHG